MPRETLINLVLLCLYGSYNEMPLVADNPFALLLAARVSLPLI